MLGLSAERGIPQAANSSLYTGAKTFVATEPVIAQTYPDLPARKGIPKRGHVTAFTGAVFFQSLPVDDVR
jgi:hypothetical protein